MGSTGRSTTRMSALRRTIRTERRCAAASPHAGSASRRPCSFSASARSARQWRRASRFVAPARARAVALAALAQHRACRTPVDELPTDLRCLTKEGPPFGDPSFVEKTGGVLLSQALAGQVPSALRGLTALFGMGRGVSPSLKPPEKGERPRPPQSFKTAQRHNEYQKIRQALDPLVPVSFRRYRPSRSGLSTWWSTRGLTPSRGWESSSRGRLPA